MRGPSFFSGLGCCLALPQAVPRRRTPEMGLLSFCLGSTSAAVQPEHQLGDHPNTDRTSVIRRAIAAKPTADNADELVGLLTLAQQGELHSAFRKFDVNGNGTM